MEKSRPASLDDLKTLIKALNEQNAEYLLIGGYALFAHGYHRATTDIDILVPADRNAGVKIIKALLVLPDKAANQIDIAWFDEGDNIRVADEIVVDLMFSACGQNYESLKRYSETIMLDDIPVKTLNLQGMLLTKQGVRDKDSSDRAVLEQALQQINKSNKTSY